MLENNNNFYTPNGIHVYTKDELVNDSLDLESTVSELEAKLPEHHFFRINRQQIVNLKAIKNVTPWFNGKLKIALNNGNEVEVSRRQSQKFKQDLEL